MSDGGALSHALMFNLRGKTALVTGSRRGIGRAIALALAGAGAHVIGTSTIAPDAHVAGTGVEREFPTYTCDLGDRDSLYALVEEIRRDVGSIDILVNNAGVILRAPADKHSDEDWDRVIQVDLSGQFILTRELAKPMLQRRSGKVIFVASLLSFQGGINVPSYAAAKGGVAQLIKALANEWAQRGVNVNAIAPGYISTDLTGALREDPARSQQILARIPAGRWGDPADLAGAALFLASAASDYVHGAVIPVDGGWLAR